MNNEILEFLKVNLNDINFIIDEMRNILKMDRINDARSFSLLNILFNFIKEEKIEILFNKLNEMDESIYQNIQNFIKEEQFNIIDYFTLLNLQRKEEFPKLVDFEWKFVGLSNLEKFELFEMIPKILLKLIFNNGTEKIIESDFASLKKLQEEMEENIMSFNSTYAKRINNFAK